MSSAMQPAIAGQAIASPRNPRQAALKRQRPVEVDEDTDEEMGGQQKGVVSHSTVEKRRRDRLNTLIDLLAEQVPPSSVKYTDVRRPKHTVLSDTLGLLAKLRTVLMGYEETIASLQAKLARTQAEAATVAPVPDCSTDCSSDCTGGDRPYQNNGSPLAGAGCNPYAARGRDSPSTKANNAAASKAAAPQSPVGLQRPNSLPSSASLTRLEGQQSIPGLSVQPEASLPLPLPQREPIAAPVACQGRRRSSEQAVLQLPYLLAPTQQQHVDLSSGALMDQSLLLVDSLEWYHPAAHQADGPMDPPASMIPNIGRPSSSGGALPNVVVRESWPGTFTVHIECMDRPGLLLSLEQVIKSLPVVVDEAVMPAPESLDRPQRTVRMQLHLLPDCDLQADQLQFVIAMSLC